MNDEDGDRRDQAWSRLYADRQPAPELEDRAVAAWRASLGEEQAVSAWRGQARAGGAYGWLLRVAAGLILFAAGWGTARLATPASERPAEPTTTVSTTPRPAFMLLLWQGPEFEIPSPDGGVEEYAAWARSLAEGGLRVSGDELGTESETVAAPGVVPGAAEEAVLSGYFLVEVGDAAAAVELARGHPHVAHGGWVEVAPVVRR